MGSLSIASSEARVDVFGRALAGARVVALVLTALALIPLHYLWRLLRIGSPWPRLFLGGAARICGARVRIEGKPLRRDVFYLANHISWLDILVMGGASGSAFVAKAELKQAPVIGWLADINRTVYVSRADRLGIAGQIEMLREALAENWAVTVFPEGTTGDGHVLMQFKPALLQVLDPPPRHVRVQPVVLDYGAAAPEIAWNDPETGKENVLRLLSRSRPIDVTVRFLEPFSPVDHRGRKNVAAEARRRMLSGRVAAANAPASAEGGPAL